MHSGDSASARIDDLTEPTAERRDDDKANRITEVDERGTMIGNRPGQPAAHLLQDAHTVHRASA